jgi:hypothetical protein
LPEPWAHARPFEAIGREDEFCSLESRHLPFVNREMEAVALGQARPIAVAARQNSSTSQGWAGRSTIDFAISRRIVAGPQSEFSGMSEARDRNDILIHLHILPATHTKMRYLRIAY